MFCKHCGSKISETEKFCKSCGWEIVIPDPIKTVVTEEPVSPSYKTETAKPPTALSSVSRKRAAYNPTPLIMSILIVICGLAFPLYSFWGGLTPEFKKTGIEIVSEYLDNDDPWRYWVVRFTVFAVVPAVFCFFFAIGNSKIGTTIFSGAGIGLLIYTLINCINNTYSENVFGENCSVTLAYWIILAMYFVAFGASCSGKRR